MPLAVLLAGEGGVTEIIIDLLGQWPGIRVNHLRPGRPVQGAGVGCPRVVYRLQLAGKRPHWCGHDAPGEVALIIAGIGLSQGIIAQSLCGVSIMMAVITTLVVPIRLIPLFRLKGSGLSRPETAEIVSPSSGPGSLAVEDTANDD